MRTAVGIFLVTLAAVMALGSRERPWGDARIMYEVAESIALHGRVGIATEWPPQSHRGSDGNVYAQYALGPSAVQVPGIWLRQAITAIAPDAYELTLVVTSHLASACLAAGTASLLFLCALELGVTSTFALLGALVLVPTTMLGVYARMPYSEALQAFASIGLFRAAWRARYPGGIDSPGSAGARSTPVEGVRSEITARQRMWPWASLGLWGGGLILAKLVFLPSALLAVLWAIRLTMRDRAATARYLAAVVAGMAPALAATLIYNHARWGSPWDTGYGDTLSLWHGTHPLMWWNGCWGLLFSSGKSFWLYSPPLVMACCGVWALRKRQPSALWLIASIALPSFVFYAGFLSWSGDYAWGPRYLVFATPIVGLVALYWVHRTWTRRGTRIATVLLLVTGLVITTLGSALYWDHWIRVSIAAKKHWLGEPDRGGARPPQNALGLCDSCSEDMFAQQWLPAFNPVAGHAWLMRHIMNGDSWTIAQRDAPWRQFTDVDTPSAAGAYSAARLDWWGTALADPKLRKAALLWLGCFGVCGAIGLAVLRRRAIT